MKKILNITMIYKVFDDRNHCDMKEHFRVFTYKLSSPNFWGSYKEINKIALCNWLTVEFQTFSSINI